MSTLVVGDKVSCLTCGHEWKFGSLETHACDAVLLRRLKVFLPVLLEQARQQEQFLAGKQDLTCAQPLAGNDRKLRLVFKKVGDIARALDVLERYGKKAQRVQLHRELTEAAACLVDWMEALNVPRGSGEATTSHH